MHHVFLLAIKGGCMPSVKREVTWMLYKLTHYSSNRWAHAGLVTVCIVSRDHRLFHQLVIIDAFVSIFCMTILLSKIFSLLLSPSLLFLSFFHSHTLFIWSVIHSRVVMEHFSSRANSFHPLIHCTSKWASVCAFLHFDQRCLAHVFYTFCHSSLPVTRRQVSLYL